MVTSHFIQKKWNFTTCYMGENHGIMSLPPLKLLVSVYEVPTFDVPNKTIKRLPTTYKLFYNAVYDKETVII